MRRSSWRTQQREWRRGADSKRSRPKKHPLSIPLIVLGVCVFGVGSWFFIFSHFFIIDLVDVVVEGDIDPAAVRQIVFEHMEGRRLLVLPRSNVFFFESSAARREIENSFAVTNLRIQRKFPNRISVSISGKRFRALWYTQGILYELAPSGQIVKNVDRGAVELPAEFRVISSSSTTLASEPKEKKRKETVTIPMIADEKNQPAALGQTVIPKDDLTFVTSLPGALSEIGIRLSSLSLTQGSPDFMVTTKEGWRIRFTFHASLGEQIHYLDTVLREAIKKKRKKLELVDVRFENKLFYTFKDGK